MTRVKIDIDEEKCTSPRDCAICLKMCQPAVFLLTFSDKDFYNPQDWKVVPTFPSLCVNCGYCVENCPKSAISLSWRR